VPGPASETASWLSLTEASKRLNVHPATLREWADRGRIRTFRTPGGHRRFSGDDVDALAAEAAPELALFMSALVGQARLATSAGKLATESWYARFDDAAKERQRELGHDLMRVLVAYLGDTEKDWSAEVLDLGDSYARLAQGAGLSLGDAMRAFHLFDGLVHSSAKQLSAVQVGGLAEFERHVGWFLNEVRVAMVESFSEGVNG
jgi:excisionase family DNA binding protein